MRKPLIVLLCLALLVACGDSSAPQAAGDLRSLLIHFEVQATPQAPYVDLAAGEVFFRFEGDMAASAVDPRSGRITGKGSKSLGRFGPAVVAFRVNPARSPTSSDFLTFRCLDCTIRFNDGALLRPLLPADTAPSPDEPLRASSFDIPMQGHFLQNLGALSPQTGGLGFGLRGVGCGGTQEVAGKGPLAGGRGTICMNGQFDFSSPSPAALAGVLAGFADGGDAAEVAALLQLLAGSLLTGRSDCAITMHRAGS
ncbi:hypothetical protein D0B54_22510 [Solimonas sp. K1W22B-7]|uniref:hypothetical protein n=1 Tax=Solimonas sp. K1W22B-7 TaxID=2303331 RepID=UPI000E331F61|nr:hypothetical protein [Solimonas sp. K1W22B-7]AXQ31283.1 hypothetical protein D0B54_22510 [Solimonas sp. K1W22B-7]